MNKHAQFGVFVAKLIKRAGDNGSIVGGALNVARPPMTPSTPPTPPPTPVPSAHPLTDGIQDAIHGVASPFRRLAGMFHNMTRPNPPSPPPLSGR